MSPALIALAKRTSSSSGVRAGMGTPPAVDVRRDHETTVRDGRQSEGATPPARRPRVWYKGSEATIDVWNAPDRSRPRAPRELGRAATGGVRLPGPGAGGRCAGRRDLTIHRHSARLQGSAWGRWNRSALRGCGYRDGDEGRE